MNIETQKSGKGSDDNLRKYRKTSDRNKLIKRIVIPIAALAMLIILFAVLVAVCFVVDEIEVVGLYSYTEEEIINASGIEVGGNIFSLSEKEIEENLKASFPYIKDVSLDKELPSKIILNISEEKTLFYFEIEGEYFLFNHEMRLLESFDSEEAVLANRNAISVKIPLPESSIVPQYIKLDEKYDYIPEFISEISESILSQRIKSVDLQDKYAVTIMCDNKVTVDMGDNTYISSKLAILEKLLGDNSNSVSGSVDFTDFPRYYYRFD